MASTKGTGGGGLSSTTQPKRNLFTSLFKPKDRTLTLSIDSFDLGESEEDGTNEEDSSAEILGGSSIPSAGKFNVANPPSSSSLTPTPTDHNNNVLSHSANSVSSSPNASNQTQKSPSPNKPPLESWDSGVWDTRWVPEVIFIIFLYLFYCTLLFFLIPSSLNYFKIYFAQYCRRIRRPYEKRWKKRKRKKKRRERENRNGKRKCYEARCVDLHQQEAYGLRIYGIWRIMPERRMIEIHPPQHPIVPLSRFDPIRYR